MREGSFKLVSRAALVALLAAGSLLAPAPVRGQAPQAQPAPATGRHAHAAAARQLPDHVVVDRETLAKRVAPRPGDICMLCNNPVGEDDAVYVLRGHRLPIHLEELGVDLRLQLEQLTMQLEPRGAFLQARQNQRALSPAWFFLGVYVLLGMLFAALCAHRALHAGQNPPMWFAAGLVLNLFGYLLLLSRGKREVHAPAGVPSGLRKVSATHAPQACPACGALNHPSARACIACGAKLDPKVTSEVGRAGLRSD